MIKFKLIHKARVVTKNINGNKTLLALFHLSMGKEIINATVIIRKERKYD